MSQSIFLLDLPADLEISQAYIVNLMSALGLDVNLGFEIDAACGSGRERICPHHEDAPCQCRLSVVRISDSDLVAVTLILHADAGRTELFLDPVPETPASLQLRRRVLLAIGCEHEF